MVQKVPPPPPIANRDPTLNRWLLELTAILNGQGTIDPSNVDGLPAVITQVGTNTAGIATLNTEVAALNTEVAALQTEVATLNTEVAVLQTNPVLRMGSTAPAAALGNVGDWYGNLTGAVGARVYIKTAVSTWTAFPF